MKVLVTGSSGLIGSEVCLYFAAMLFNAVYGFIHGPKIKIHDDALQTSAEQLVNLDIP